MNMKQFHSVPSLRGARSAISLLLLATASTRCSENARTGRSASPPPSAADAFEVAPEEATPDGVGEAPMGGAGGAPAEPTAEGVASGGAIALAETAAPNFGGAAGGGADAAESLARTGEVVLTAVVVPVTPDGTRGIAAEWTNGTDHAIFLRGCATADGWYLQGQEWREHGPFAVCTTETPAVEVGPGETYLDLAGAAPPPNRGSNVWRLVARYGTGCRSGELFGASECREVHELTSVNQLRWK